MEIKEVLDDIQKGIGKKGFLILSFSIVGLFIYMLFKNSNGNGSTYIVPSGYTSYPDAVTNANVIIDEVNKNTNYNADVILDKMDESFGITNDYINAGLEGVNKGLESIDDRFESVDNTLSDINKDISNLDKNVANNGTAINKVQGSIDKVQGSVNKVQGSLNGIQSTVDKNTSTLDKIQSNTAKKPELNISPSIKNNPVKYYPKITYPGISIEGLKRVYPSSGVGISKGDISTAFVIRK